MAEKVPKRGIAEEEREQIVVAVFEDLALDGGVLASLDQDQRRVPAGKVLHHEPVLEPVKFGKAVRRDGMTRPGAGFVAEDGGEHPQVGVTLGEDEVESEGGGDGVVDAGR